MAIGTLPRRDHVLPGQLKPGGRVVEHRVGPMDRVVTRLASCGKAG